MLSLIAFTIVSTMIFLAGLVHLRRPVFASASQRKSSEIRCLDLNGSYRLRAFGKRRRRQSVAVSPAFSEGCGAATIRQWQRPSGLH